MDTTVDNEAFKFVLTTVDSVSGDCDVTQRKGKVLCIYDMKLVFSVTGTKKDDEKDFTATVTLVEFFHDQDEDEYVFEVTSDYGSDIKKHFVPALRAKLIKFQSDLILAHEKDVQHAT